LGALLGVFCIQRVDFFRIEIVMINEHDEIYNMNHYFIS